MKILLPQNCILLKLGAVVVPLVLCLLSISAPPSSAQAPQRDRQLKRDSDTQPNPVGQRRVALVIGNGAYQNASRLANPVNDATDIAAALRELGFELVGSRAHVNQNADQMKRLIIDFGEMLGGGGVGLFYYAGHGVQSEGHNYLIPVEANLLKEKTLEFDAVDVNRVLAQMDAAGNGFNIVILDACRNNPFSRSWRDAGQGLAQVNAPEGTLIAYATSPGKVASDGSGRNGTYTTELLREMRAPGLKIEEMFKAVRAGVKMATKDQQTPWESSSLVGEFCLSGRCDNGRVVTNDPGSSSGARMDSAAIELSYWETIKNSNDPEDFKSYLAKYPNGQFADLAHRRAVAKPVGQSSPNMKEIGNTQPAESRSETLASRVASAKEHYEKGHNLFSESKYAEAAAALRLAVQFDPTEGHYHFYLGWALEYLKNLPEAETEYREAVRLEPNGLYNFDNLIGVLKQEKKFDDIEALLRERAEKNSDARRYKELGQVLAQREKYAEAEKELREAVRLAPNDADFFNSPRAALASFLVEQKKFPEAEQQYRELIRLKPEDTYRHYRLGSDVFEAQGKWAEAEREYREELRLDPKNIDPLITVLIKQKKFAEAENELKARGLHHKLAEFLRGQNRFGESEQEYKEAIREDPNDRYAVGHFVRALVAQGKFSEAEDELKAFLKRKPDDASSYYDLGNLFRDQNKWPEAEAAYREAVRIEPKNYHSSLGRALLAQNKLTEAESQYREEMRLDPKALGDLSSFLISQKRNSEAEALWHTFIQAAPNDDGRHYSFGNFLSSRKRYSEAETEFREALKLKLDDTYSQLSLAVVLAKEGKWPEADAIYKERIKSAPNDESKHKEYADALADQRKWAEAETEYRERMRLKPESFSYRVDLAELFVKQKKLAEAEIEYREYVRISPDDGASHFALASFLAAQRKWTAAEAEFREAIRLHPDYSLYHDSFGNSLVKQDRWNEAEKEFREAMKLKPANAIIRNHLGLALQNQNKWSDAEKEYAEAIKLSPDDGRYDTSLALAYQHFNRPTEAAAEYKKAELKLRKQLEDYPESAWVHNGLGLCLERQNRLPEAEAELKEAVRLNPDLVDYQDNLKRVVDAQQKKTP